ncbi:MAG: phage tail tape measure protein, partial [Clostridia bacterium]|nr:phage tail tape measure protein [Clostridia bacterium]
MSKEIDEKVVEMRFDNDQFEKNVQTSLSSLEKLKSGLNFNGAAKGLDEISSSVEDTSSVMSTLTNGVESVGKKFSALEVVAVAALVNITTQVVNTAEQLFKSLSLDQITAGFTKYEEKTTAMQTIINATGLSLEEVNEQLDKLNWFTDETSYNFTDMVSNIGKFTSMGIDLDTSVTAMMGIANWAAVSGQGTEEASRAMYNLAQAIGVGAVKLTDWKSIENANMATQEFKEIVIETAKELGTLDEEAQTTSGTLVESSNFSSTLSEGWFTSDVLLAALEKYGNYSEEVYKVVQEEGVTAAEAMELITDDTMELGEKAFKAAQEAKTFTDAINATKDAVSTGWMNTFEIIFGNYEEAKVLWTDLANELYDVFASGAEARNDLLSEWKELGGRDLLVDSFFNALTALENVIATVKEAFRDIFPAKTAEQLYSMTQSLYNFTERLANAEKPLDTIKRILEGFFSAIDIAKQFFSALFRALSPVFSMLKKVTGNIVGCTTSLSDFIVGIDETIRETQFFDNLFEKIVNTIKKVVT